MIITKAYVAPPKRPRPLDFAQPFDRTNDLYREAIDQNRAMVGIADPIRVSVQTDIPGIVRIAHRRIPLTGNTPEVNGGWVDSFAPFAAKQEYAQSIDTTQNGAGIYGQLPWLERTNIRKPRSQTWSRVMDILTGQV